MTTVMNWVNANRAVYLGNATAMRDFRVQLRGNRAVLVFGAYLILLIGAAMFYYATAVGTGNFSVVGAQAYLQSFYSAVIQLLGIAVCVVAPALCATAVVAERQRRSFDLIFSAPVTPKYYLVGKMLSTYRYIWMLLVLSIPVTATCVMLGGASWSDVLESYVLLSVQGVILTSGSLLISTLASKPVSAVFMSYAFSVPYLYFLGVNSHFALLQAFNQHTQHAPFFVTLYPFGTTQAIGTSTALGAFDIPNWILGIFAALALCKLSLLAAGAVLSPSGAEARSLRLHGLIYATVGLGLTGFGLYGLYATQEDPSAALGRSLVWATLPLSFFVPLMTCSGLSDERRFRPNGMFARRNLLTASPATALPYLWLLLGCGSIGLLTGYLFAAWGHPATAAAIASDGVADAVKRGPVLSPAFFEYVLFTFGLWTFYWSLGRFASTLSLGVRAARGIAFTSFLLICVAPLPVLMTLTYWTNDPTVSSLWSLWILRSAIDTSGTGPILAANYAVILLLLAGPIAAYAETKLKTQLVQREAVRDAAAA